MRTFCSNSIFGIKNNNDPNETTLKICFICETHQHILLMQPTINNMADTCATSRILLSLMLRLLGLLLRPGATDSSGSPGGDQTNLNISVHYSKTYSNTNY